MPPLNADAVLTLRSPLLVELDVQAVRLPASKLSAKIASPAAAGAGAGLACPKEAVTSMLRTTRL
jgi:hypothetical protein